MKRTLLGIVGLVAGVTAAAAYYGHRRAEEVTTVWVVLAFGLLMIPYFALGFDRVVEALREMGRSSAARTERSRWPAPRGCPPSGRPRARPAPR